MAFRRARARAARHKWWVRQSFVAAVGAIVIVAGVLVYFSLPLVFGTTMHGKTVSCDEQISHSSRGGDSKSYACLVEMSDGSQRTVTADTNYDYGQTINYREWNGSAYVTRDVVVLSMSIGGVTLLLLLFVVWAGIPERKPKGVEAADEQSEAPVTL